MYTLLTIFDDPAKMDALWRAWVSFCLVGLIIWNWLDEWERSDK